MTKHLLLIGGGVMQLPVLRLARSLGVTTVCLDGNPQALGKGEADYFYQADIKDEKICLEKALDHRSVHRIDGVLTVGTDFSTTVAYLAQALGLPGIPYETAHCAKDKSLMRQVFQDKGVPSPRFSLFTSVPTAELVLGFSYPAVVKPADNMGSRGVRRVDDDQSCRTALAQALAYSPSGKAVVEEFIDGPEFSLDAIVRDGKIFPMGMADRTIIFPPYFVEVGHTFPSGADPQVRKEVWASFELGVKALGITWGAAKGDVKYTPGKGAFIGEIAARLSGGYMSGWTYPYSSGRSSIRWAIENALGLPLTPQPEESRLPVVERAWISIPGTIKEVVFREKVEQIPGVRDVFLNFSPGKGMVLPRNNVEKGGNVICTGTTIEEAEASARQARNAVVPRLQVPQDTTEQFFWQQTESPWWFDQARTLQKQTDLAELLALGQSGVFDGRDWLANSDQTAGKDVYGNSLIQLLSLFTELTGMGLTELSSFPPAFWYFILKGGLQGALYFKEGYEKNLWPFT